MTHSKIRVATRKLRAAGSMGTRKLLRPTAFVDSPLGKRDAGQTHTKVRHFGVDAGVEVDVADAATEIADIELGLGDGGDPDRLVVSARQDLGCADDRLYHRAVQGVALGFGAPVGPY